MIDTPWREATQEEKDIIIKIINSQKSVNIGIIINIIPCIMLTFCFFAMLFVFRDEIVLAVIIGIMIILGIVKFGKNAVFEIRKSHCKKIYICDAIIIVKFESNSSVEHHYVTVTVMENGKAVNKDIILGTEQYHKLKPGDAVKIVRFGDDFNAENLYIL